jgi:putative DNA primase/helicase
VNDVSALRPDQHQHPSPAALLASALRYAGRGWHVFPCWPPGEGRPCACPDPDCGTPDPDQPERLRGSPAKHPVGSLVPHGFQQASADAAAVDRWWRARPDANVGLRTGALSGLVVVDVDGAEGAEALRSLVARHGRFEAAWARTGSGGWHAYLAHPGREIPNSGRRLGPGLDVRGDGGYVVAPPSRHFCGGWYRWVRGLPDRLPGILPWLVELMLPPAPPAPSRPVQLSRSGLSPYVVAAVEGEAREAAAAPAGQRNNQLFRSARRLGQLVGAGLVPEDSVADILLIAAQAAGLGEREAQATIRSGLRAGARHPRDVRP